MIAVRIAKNVFTIIFINHFIACVWWGIGIDGDPEHRWVEPFLHLAENSDGADSFGLGYHYLVSLHWSLTQFTPATMEVQPKNIRERLYNVVVLIIGLSVFSSFLSSITAAATHLRYVSQQRAIREGTIRRFLAEHKVSMELSSSISFFLREQRRVRTTRLHEQDLDELSDLPDALRVKLRSEIYAPPVLPHPFFFHLNNAHRSCMGDVCNRAMKEVTALAGNDVFYFGMKGRKMLFVIHGELDYVYVASATDDAAIVADDANEGVGTTSTSLMQEHSTKLSKDQWAVEMVLWMSWMHRGRLTPHTEVDLMELDAQQFHSVIKQWETAFAHCRAYARVYVERMLKSCRENGSQLTDLWGSRADDLQDLAQDAFDDTGASMQNVWNGRLGRAKQLVRNISGDSVTKLIMLSPRSGDPASPRSSAAPTPQVSGDLFRR
eukprot:gnl/TRDRNA2_/TRDRNA2_118144_c1_seq1.p1 gnl/TRDRNA2_/TRDRNA2_118144_c1~~gnl/TRDRNA2_/TRDRNA2_118144_c1_seq1.p1  ORF type:complete len:436 (+),score=76.53 gnl/TRDRNA2_/TRDRNA2_118144_c1_seq1:3-1310(+)